MPLPDFVNEPVSVELRISSDGQALPIAFTRRARRVVLSDVGRAQREESDQGVRITWMARSPEGVTYELGYDPWRETWTLIRVWGDSGAI